MSGDGIERRWRLAEDIVREAGHLARAFFDNRATLVVEEKGPQDFVSRADQETEALIVSRLALECPADGVLGEEGGLRGDGSHALWVLDPIDGTDNFLRGLPLWGVSLALVVEGRLELGLIYNPVTDEMFSGRRGFGAFCNGRRCRVSATADLRRACIGLGFSHAQGVDPYAAAVSSLLATGSEYRRLGSAAISLAYVADGRIEGFYNKRTKSWDVLGGLLLVQEAGGRSNDFLKNDGLHRAGPIFATAPQVWAPVAAALGLDG